MPSYSNQQSPAQLSSDEELKKARNREAAQRCREKKKRWQQGLQKTVTDLEERNSALEEEVQSLRNKIWKMSELLLRHPEDPTIVEFFRTRNAPVTPPAAAPAAGSSSTGAAIAATMSTNSAAIAATPIPSTASPMSATSVLSGVPTGGSNIFTAPSQPQGGVSSGFEFPALGNSSLSTMNPQGMPSEELLDSWGPVDYSGIDLGNDFGDFTAGESFDAPF